MIDSESRNKMAENAILNSRRFNIEDVTEKYLNVFNDLLNEK